MKGSPQKAHVLYVGVAEEDGSQARLTQACGESQAPSHKSQVASQKLRVAREGSQVTSGQARVTPDDASAVQRRDQVFGHKASVTSHA